MLKLRFVEGSCQGEEGGRWGALILSTGTFLKSLGDMLVLSAPAGFIAKP